MKKLNSNNYYQRFATRLTARTCRTEGIPAIKIEVKHLRRGGRACFDTRYISIPAWACITKQYFVYYIIHEITHFIMQTGGHGIAFKAKEQEILKRYNIKLQYNKAYPKYIIDYKTDEVICNKYGEKIS